MGVLAAIFALAGAGFNLFQPIISLPTSEIFSRRFEISIVDILRMIVSNANELSNRNWKLFAEAFTEAFRYAQPEDIIQLCVGLAIFITPILALIGAIQAASRKGGSFLLGLCAAVCGANFFFLNSSMGRLSSELRQVVESISSPQIFLLWAALYGVAMFCALFISDDKVVTVKEKETVYVPKPHQAERDSALDHLVNRVNTLSDRMNGMKTQSSDVPENEPAQVPVYEPILGVETEALIKRAVLFLEDGEFDNAGRYIEQALNQDPENPRVYFTKLMFERKVHSVEELIERSETPLEDEKLFQRALRFADVQYKAQLDNYAQRVSEKIEQAQAEREAEKERVRAEQEADREKRYQEILNLKETASNIVDLQELLSKILFLRPYKDTNNLYNEVNQALKNETDYRSAIHLLESSKKSADFERAVNMLQSLGDYKEAAARIESAEKLRNEAREKEKARKKSITTISGVILSILLTLASWSGIRWYNDRAERLAQERAIEAEAQKVYSSAEINEVNGNLETALLQFSHALKLGHLEAQKRIVALQEKIKARNNKSDEDAYARAVKYLDDKNYSQAVEIFRRLANEGYAPAQDKLAWMYQNGWGVEQSYAQAVSWFRKAAAQGNTEALASMGLMYLRGWGVTRDYDTALEWYGKAAAQGSEVARRRMNSIELLKANKAKIPSIERGIGFPVPGTIFAETLSVKQYPETNARRVKTLKTGHPVSVSRAVESDNDYWFYVKTASGTEGWVLGSYVKLIDRDLSYQERQNRRVSLPAVGRVTDISSELNVRNIPSVKGSTVVDKLNNGFYIEHVLEVFATENVDWYHVRYLNGGWTEGWVSGKYINITGSD